MKKWFLLFVLWSFGFTAINAQIAPGSIAPNFTTTDLNGNTYTLYDILDQGYTVYMDVYATWCGPCWNYHNTHALRDLWDINGPGGTNEVFVFGIEGDFGTSVPCITNSAGCVGGTQGNWTTGINYPMCDDGNVAAAYQISYYPTIYCICPLDRKVYECGQLSRVGLLNYRNTHCTTPSVAVTINNVTEPRCFGSNTGAIDISVSVGNPPYTYNWSNGTHTQDLNNIPAGTYSCSITSSNGLTGETGPIEVTGPASPLLVSTIELTQPGCGLPGSAIVEASGGWPANYTYVWSNTQQGESLTGVAAGTYTVTVTDDNLCTKTHNVVMVTPIPPVAVIAPPPAITCAAPTITINGSNSSNGGDFIYSWTGGTIVSGANTLNPVVSGAGNYSLVVTNIENNCTATAITSVATNITTPTANAGPVASVNCSQTTATLQGSGSTGNNFSYLWIASNGGVIVSGGTTFTPVVGAAGTYTLRVTDNTNGCSQTASTTVSGNSTSLTAAATGGTLTCTANSVNLAATTPAAGATFAWTGPNGFTSAAQNPSVTATGDYTVVVSDPANGCTGTALAAVTSNTATPGAAATGGAITCTTTNIALAGNSPTSNVSYAWSGPNNYTSIEQNPAVTVNGDYNLVVTASNGCTSTATAAVSLNNAAPIANVATPGNLNCNNAQLQLNGIASSQGVNFTYTWSTANGNIVSGANTLTPLVDLAGSYSLLVSNTENGCTQTTAATVAQSAPVSANIASTTNVSCNGTATGAATAGATGGNATYSYTWSNGANTAAVSGLQAGTYIVVVTDGENCTATSSVAIAQPDPLATNATATAQSANGINDGTATAIPTGGNASYAYLWNTGAVTATINGLAPGNYSVVVTDANGCTAEQSVTVNSFNCALASAITGTNVSCFGSNNGAAAITLTGAANPVSYLWSNGAVTPSIENLVAGNYSVNILDGSNCPAQLNIAITEPSALAANTTATNETAAGASDGTASAVPVGGTGNYTYLWSNGGTTATITGLTPGTYTVNVSDGNNCVATQSVVVNSYLCTIATTLTSNNITCFGATNGSATIALNGGAAPFTYTWSNGSTTATVSNLPAGNYSVIVKDANDCEINGNIAISEPAALEVAVAAVVNVTCPNEAVGSISLNTQGGTSGYTYLWSNGATESIAAGLVAGSYSVVVTDANGCTQNAAATVASNDNIAPTVTAQNATIALGQNGEVILTSANINAQASDNCGEATTTLSPTTFNCDQLGEHTIMLTAKDAAGNITTTTVVVTVVDNIAPTLTCPANIVRCANDNTVSYAAPVATDNCLSAGGGQWNLTSGLPSGSQFPVGTTVQTYTYTDQSGNQGACSFNIIVNQGPTGVTTVVNNATVGQTNGSVNASVVGGTSPFTYSWTTTDGQVVSTEEDLNNVGVGVYTLVVTDAYGCTYSAGPVEVKGVVGTQEPTWLGAVSIRPNPTSGITQIVFNQLPGTEVEISLTDATGRMLRRQLSDNQYNIQIDCTDLPEGMYFVRFLAGNESGVRKLIVTK